MYLKGRRSSLIVFEDGTKQLAENLEKDLSLFSGIQDVRILPISRNGRVFLKIQICPERHSVEMAQLTVKHWVNIRHLRNRLDTIEVVTSPFERTDLGKLKRTVD